jgi:hypothetical protein
MVWIALVFVVSLTFATGNSLVYADDRYDRYNRYDRYDNYDEKYDYYGGYGDHRHEGKGKHSPYEKIGETLGWGAIIAMGVAGVIYILRRSTKTVVNKFPDAKDKFISVTRFLGKYHIGIGVIALILSIIHGVLMYLSEGRLDGDGLIGLGSVIFMALASILGSVLYKMKKVKSLRISHSALIALAFIVALIHIIGA